MNAIIKVNATRSLDGKKEVREYEVDIFKNNNQLTIEYPNHKYFPWDIIRTGKFEIELQPHEEEIGCNNSCETCLTPIC